MKKLQFSLQPWLDELDQQWRQLPGQRKRRIVLYSFTGYVILTVAVVLQVIFTAGNNREPVATGRISTPVAGNLENPNLKNENNERDK